MQVTRLPVDTGITGWNAILPAPKPAQRPEAGLVSDYLVIGAGFAGLSAARRLVQIDPKSTICVVDAGRIGEGPGGRNSGFMIDLPHELSSQDYASSLDRDRQIIALNRQAIGFARDAAREFDMPEGTFDPCGKTNGAVAGRAIHHNDSYARHLERLGEPFRILDADGMQELTGSDFYRSGLETPSTVLIQPAQYVRSFADGLADQVRLFESTPVTGLSRENGRWAATTPEGTLMARKVILATNGHIESFGHFRRRIFHVILYASMTRTLDHKEEKLTGRDRWGVTPSDPAATTMRKFIGPDGARIVTRNQMTYAPNLQATSQQLARMAERHIAAFQRRYPQLAHVEQEYAWAGRLCLSRNSAPAFGEVEEGLYAACCQNGLGSTRGTLAGMAAAEFAAEGRTPLVEKMLGAGSPEKLPPPPLDSIGARVFMGLAEWKARSEI